MKRAGMRRFSIWFLLIPIPLLGWDEIKPIPRKDQVLFSKARELLLTRDGKVIDRLACQRIDLPYPNSPADHQVSTHIGRTRRGDLFIAVAGHQAQSLFRSTDQGQSWTRWSLNWPKQRSFGNFVVLQDDSFLVGSAGGDKPLRFYRSSDLGQTWQPLSAIVADPFRRIHLDGDFTQLRDGTILLPVNRHNPAVKGEPWTTGTYAQYVFRSSDGGRTWEGGGSDEFWRTLDQAKLQIEGSSLKSRIPGVGGTFPGCFETQLTELSNGRLVAAFRYSGRPQSWHPAKEEEWEMKASRERMIPIVPGVSGDVRILKYIFLGDSFDGGGSWENFRPVLDQKGRSVLWYGSLHGQVLELADGRWVLVHVRRYPREDQQVLARVSKDGGQTWSREAYRLIYGSGYPRSLVLEDGTIVTVGGSTLTTPGGPVPPGGRFSGQVIRWRLRTD